MTPTSEARSDGKQARREGVPQTDNPHDYPTGPGPGTPSYRAWDEGWRIEDAAARAKRKGVIYGR